MNTKIRGEQIQDLTITNINIANDAGIEQSKIEQTGGWIQDGTVSLVSDAPTWDGSQAGQLYYVTSTDELYIGTSADPYYALAMGGSEGYDADVNVLAGTDATNFNSPEGPVTVTLDSTTTNAQQVVDEINTSLANASFNLSEYLEAYIADTDNDYIGLRLLSPDYSDFTITANTTLGWGSGTYTDNVVGTNSMTSGHDWLGSNEETIDITVTRVNAGSDFEVSTSLEIAPDAANIEVYLNGALMENAANGDYTVNTGADPVVVSFNYDVFDVDKVTFIIRAGASLTNYVTKKALSEDPEIPRFTSGTTQPSSPKEGDEFYDTGAGTFSKYLGGSWVQLNP